MPVFYFLVFAAAILLWVLLSSTYVPLGTLAKRIWKDASDAMDDDGEENKTNEGENV